MCFWVVPSHILEKATPLTFNACKCVWMILLTSISMQCLVSLRWPCFCTCILLCWYGLLIRRRTIVHFLSFHRFGNTAYLHISVAFIQMLKALSMWKLIANGFLNLLTEPYKILITVDILDFSASGNISHGCFMWHWQIKVGCVLQHVAGQCRSCRFLVRGNTF